MLPFSLEWGFAPNDDAGPDEHRPEPLLVLSSGKCDGESLRHLMDDVDACLSFARSWSNLTLVTYRSRPESWCNLNRKGNEGGGAQAFRRPRKLNLKVKNHLRPPSPRYNNAYDIRIDQISTCHLLCYVSCSSHTINLTDRRCKIHLFHVLQLVSAWIDTTLPLLANHLCATLY